MTPSGLYTLFQFVLLLTIKCIDAGFEGPYHIRTPSGKCLDVDLNGGRLQIYGCHSGPNQKFYYDRSRHILRVGSKNGKCIDVWGGRMRNGANLGTYKCHHHDNQQFYRSGDHIKSKNGKCLDVSGEQIHTNGAKLTLWDCHGRKNQRFTWEKLGTSHIMGPYQIKTDSGKCLDVKGRRYTSNGAKVHIWQCHGGKNQRWFYDPSTKSFRAGTKNGKCMDLSGGRLRNGAVLQIWNCHTGDNQKLYPSGNHIKTKHGKCLDVSGGHIYRNGGRVHLWGCHGGKNQRWRLVQKRKKKRRKRRKKRRPRKKRRRRRRKRRKRRRRVRGKRRYRKWKCTTITLSDRERKECIRRRIGVNRRRFNRRMRRWYRTFKMTMRRRKRGNRNGCTRCRMARRFRMGCGMGIRSGICGNGQGKLSGGSSNSALGQVLAPRGGAMTRGLMKLLEQEIKMHHAPTQFQRVGQQGMTQYMEQQNVANELKQQDAMTNSELQRMEGVMKGEDREIGALTNIYKNKGKHDNNGMLKMAKLLRGHRANEPLTYQEQYNKYLRHYDKFNRDWYKAVLGAHETEEGDNLLEIHDVDR